MQAHAAAYLAVSAPTLAVASGAISDVPRPDPPRVYASSLKVRREVANMFVTRPYRGVPSTTGPSVKKSGYDFTKASSIIARPGRAH